MDDELEKFEAGLRRLPPAAAPPDLMARLRAAKVAAHSVSESPAILRFRWADWLAGWRRLAAAAAPATTILLLWLALRPAVGPGKAEAADSTGIKADAVQVDRSLLASFDAVAQLPDGVPVRFHCCKWRDDVVLHDHADGVFITQSTPRIEVVPVRFETY